VLAARAAHVDDSFLDVLALVLLVARVIQSTVHISFARQRRRALTVGARSALRPAPGDPCVCRP
jgi:hypothetical protein